MKQPLNLSLYIYQGQTFDDGLTLQDSADAALDLTGYTAHMQARVDITDATPQITWSDTTGEIVIGGTAGTVTFNVSATSTAALATNNEPTTWVYDLVLTSPTGEAERVVQGSMIISPAVTRG